MDDSTEEQIADFWKFCKVAHLQAYSVPLNMAHIELIYQAFESRILEKIMRESAINLFPDDKLKEKK